MTATSDTARKLAATAATATMLLAVAARVRAADEGVNGFMLGPLAVLPTLGVETDYDDNILVQAKDPEADGVFRGVGRLDLRLPRPSETEPRPSPPPPDSERPIVTPSELLDAASARLVFPSDVATPETSDDPGYVPQRDPGLSRARPHTTLDLGYEAAGTVFASHGEFNTLDQSVSGAATQTLPGGFALGVAGEWIDRTTTSSDLSDFAQFASDLRLVGANFDRGAIGALVGWAPTPVWYLETDGLYYVSTLGPKPYDLFGFDVFEASFKLRRTFDGGWLIEPRLDAGRIDGQATAAALRRSGLVQPFVPLDFTGDPRAATLTQGSVRVAGPLTPKVSLEARAGAQSRTFDENAFTGYLDFLAEGTLTWAVQPHLKLEAGGSREPLDVFGKDGSFLVRDQGLARASLVFLRDWDAHLEADGGLDVFDRESSLTGEERRDRFVGGELGLGWEPHPWLRVEASLRGRTRSSNESTEATERIRTGLRLWLRY